MEGHIQHTQVPRQRMPLQHLDWHEEWVLQQITVEEKDSGHSWTREPPGSQTRVNTHLYTMPWQTMTLPSSEPDAKSGYRGWKATARRAFLWCLGEDGTASRCSRLEGPCRPTAGRAPHLSTLYGLVERSRSNHTSLLS